MDQSDDMPRRDFLARVAGAGTIATLAIASPIGSGVANASGRFPGVRDATIRSFAPFAGQGFRVVRPDGRSQVLGLASIEESPATPGKNEAGKRFRRPYSLLFQDQEGPALPQGTYRFQHRMLGAFDLFIVPIGMPRDGMVYQAVFG